MARVGNQNLTLTFFFIFFNADWDVTTFVLDSFPHTRFQGKPFNKPFLYNRYGRILFTQEKIRGRSKSNTFKRRKEQCYCSERERERVISSNEN